MGCGLVITVGSDVGMSITCHHLQPGSEGRCSVLKLPLLVDGSCWGAVVEGMDLGCGLGVLMCWSESGCECSRCYYSHSAG